MLVIAYGVLLATWLLSAVVVIPVPVNLVLSATSIVYIGCHRSLKLLLSEENGGIAHKDKEIISTNDAYKLPFVGSIALFSLYVAFKYFDKTLVNVLLAVYFSLAGIFTLTGTLSPLLTTFLPSTKRNGAKFHLPLVGEVDATFTIAELISLLLATVFSIYYLQTKHYLMNNILGISFCVQSIERISIGSYKIGAIALIGLFFYDIFWVFGTDVMVTVAKSFDGPIKLLFPRVLPTLTSKGQFSLLGLGDIVVPGLFVAILLRFDAVRANIPQEKLLSGEGFTKPYFNANIVAYALGLVVTVLVMYVFNAAQPALLYLVPACLGASLLIAGMRGEFSALVAYDEETVPTNKLKTEKEKET